MPCKDSSSCVTIRLDNRERFVSFDFAKIACGRGITAGTGYNKYCRGKDLKEIISFTYEKVARDLKNRDEETRFILYLEWDALRSAIAQYLGIMDKDIDAERCLISSVSLDDKGQEITMVILPPKEMSKILKCSKEDKKDND